VAAESAGHSKVCDLLNIVGLESVLVLQQPLMEIRHLTLLKFVLHAYLYHNLKCMSMVILKRIYLGLDIAVNACYYKVCKNASNAIVNLPESGLGKASARQIVVIHTGTSSARNVAP
jgi:hypothetical protein